MSKMNQMPLKRQVLSWLFIIAGIMTSFYSSQSSARTTKVEGHLGIFQLDAKSGTRSGTKSGPGAYKLVVGIELIPSIEVFAGYTVIMSSGFGGDLAFGIDTGINYFFMTPYFGESATSTNSHLAVRPLWRPFVGLGFHQREFQSVRSSYAGFGGQAGVERALRQDFDLKVSLRYISLGGAQSASATELTITTGLVFSF